MSEPNKIDEIKVALDAATKGTWVPIGWSEIWSKSESCESEITTHTYITKTFHTGNRNLIAKTPEYITYLLAEIERKDEALRFYADKENYQVEFSDDDPFFVAVEKVVVDGGKRAREAL
ncbi:hypothetical protein ACH6EH_07410 [Paenibacillus sp. JSM ZJ436]